MHNIRLIVTKTVPQEIKSRLFRRKIGDVGIVCFLTIGNVHPFLYKTDMQTQKFIKHLSKHLKKGGVGYFVFSSLSDRKKLDSIISRAGLKLEILQSQNFDDEQLDICKIIKK